MGKNFGNGQNKLITFISIFILFVQAYLVACIWETTCEQSKDGFMRLDRTSFVTMTVIMPQAAYAILGDARGKIMIIKESKSKCLMVFAYMSFIVNMMTLAIVFVHLGIQETTIMKFTGWVAFSALIKLDDVFGEMTLKFLYPARNDEWFKREVATKTYNSSWTLICIVFIIFNLWAIGFNCFLFYEDKVLNTIHYPIARGITIGTWGLMLISPVIMCLFQGCACMGNQVEDDEEYEKLDA